MMEESGKKEGLLTWRQILSTAVSSTAERERIARTLDISPVTIRRWVTDETQPRQEKLRMVPDALPEYREELIASIQKEYPHIFSEGTTPSASTEMEVPSDFYARLINTYTMCIPLQRKPMVFNEIMQQLLSQLDPGRQNLSLFIAQFVPPPPGRKVRSLRLVTGQGNTPIAASFEHQTLYFGVETQVGVAAAMARRLVIQNQEMKDRTFPLQPSFGSDSIATMPVVQHNSVAGCLCIACLQPDYFSPERLDLIQHYVNLLSIAFEQDEFYEIGNIELRVIPPAAIQKPILATIQLRINERLIQARKEDRQLNRIQAEQEVLQEVEEELLQLALAVQG
jgi:GAF domain-containing protein